MNFFSPWHLLLVVVVALLLFGPKKLPELGRSVGRMFREFKNTTDINSPIAENEAPTRKEVNPAEVTRSDDVHQPGSAK
jgi:sec-independent protein translocase protein TatA